MADVVYIEKLKGFFGNLTRFMRAKSLDFETVAEPAPAAPVKGPEGNKMVISFRVLSA